jgi:hypothetical protein
MTSASASKVAFQREVASRFGLVPNFFSSAPDAPEIIERLWVFAKAGYLDNPIPSLFKERLSSTSHGSAKFDTALRAIAHSWWGEVIRQETPLSPSKPFNRRSSF